jgi:hypothetical protein
MDGPAAGLAFVVVAAIAGTVAPMAHEGYSERGAELVECLPIGHKFIDINGYASPPDLVTVGTRLVSTVEFRCAVEFRDPTLSV